MAKLRKFIINAVVCFLLPQLLLAGCSLIGFGIGSLSDSSKKDGDAIPMADLREMTRGSDIAVVLWDGRRIEGEFISVREENPGTYREQYMAAVAQLHMEGCLPRPGDSITVANRRNPLVQQKFQFRGVDPDQMVVNHTGRRAFLSDIGVLKADSASQVDLSVFSSLVHEHKLPFVTRSILLDVREATSRFQERGRSMTDTTEVLLADIVRVENIEPRDGKYIGLAVGAVLDAIAIIAFESSVESCNEQNRESCHRSAAHR